jgi:hypothetical protein
VLSEIISPVGGFDGSVPPENLRPGKTPHSENLIVEGDFLVQRSGISDYNPPIPGSHATNEERFTLAAKGYGLDGILYYVTVSERTHASATSDGGFAWTASADNLQTLGYGSASTKSYFDWTEFYEPDANDNAIVITKGDGVPVYKALSGDSLGKWYEHTGFTSVESYAQCVASYDQRLLFFNIAPDASSDPNVKRVRWSVRGDPLDFSSAGAGFDDLLDMRGFGTVLLPDRDRLLLFSNKEVWQARARRDAYAFDFAPLNRATGAPYPRTVVPTNVGVIWIGEDYHVYRLVGTEVRQFEPAIQEYLRDNLREEVEFWAKYNTDTNQYQLFFSDTTGELTTKAFYLNTTSVNPSRRDYTRDTGNWALQTFDTDSTYTESYTCGFDDVMMGFSFTNPFPRFVREDSATTMGHGVSTTSWKWRSHGLRASRDPNTYEGISELYLDYEVDSDISVDVHYSTDLGQTFSSAGTLNLTTGGQKTAFLPISPIAARHAQFELRGNTIDKMRLGSIRLTLRPYSGRRAL